MIKFNMGEGDRLPVLSATLEGADGPLDLTGATVTIYGRKAGEASVVISGSVTIDQVSPTNRKGEVHYNWAVNDTQVPGKWFIQHKVSYSGSRVTVPNDGADELWIDNFWAGAQT